MFDFDDLNLADTISTDDDLISGQDINPDDLTVIDDGDIDDWLDSIIM